MICNAGINQTVWVGGIFQVVDHL